MSKVTETKVSRKIRDHNQIRDGESTVLVILTSLGPDTGRTTWSRGRRDLGDVGKH